MAKSGVLEPGTLFQQLGRIRKRHTSNSPRHLSSKSGRGLLLLLVAVVCSLLLASRLVFVLMYFLKGRAAEVYVEPQSGVQAVLYEVSEGLRTKGDEDIVHVGWKEIGSDNEEKIEDDWIGADLLEPKDKVDNEDDKEETRPLEEETRALEEDTTRALEEDIRQLEEQTRPLGEDDGEKSVEVEEIWNAEKKFIEDMANSEAKIGDETVMGVGEKDDIEETLVREEDDISDDEGALRHRKMPDAMAYLEQLVGNLVKTGVQEDNGPYHSRRIFESDYAEMKRNLKIFIYPHDHNDPFHKIFEPSNQTPSGNYASEEFFQQALMSSSFVTKDASQADFFFMPVSITKARMDKRIDVGGLKSFCANYVTRLRSQWNYWNRSNGADHFYLSCHSVARNAMDQVPVVKQNAIQLLCPASYFLASYITHKDASVPQIWPREGPEPKEVRLIAQRKRLAFFAGALNSPVRQELQKIWASDDKIMVHQGRVPYPYSQALLTSKFCLHAKGFEVNTARLGDAMYYGCVPVVIANHYDLPYQDILDWTKFSIVISSLDIPLLKKTLEAVTDEQYAELHSQVLKARKHFQWHNPPQVYDAFHTVLYELWKRRHIVKRSSQ